MIGRVRAESRHPAPFIEGLGLGQRMKAGSAFKAGVQADLNGVLKQPGSNRCKPWHLIDALNLQVPRCDFEIIDVEEWPTGLGKARREASLGANRQEPPLPLLLAP
jgi:hypothetical protein